MNQGPSRRGRKDADEMTASPSAAESAKVPSEEVRWAWMARFVGTLVLLYGFLLFVLTAAYWASIQPPGSTVGPPSFIQDLTLKLAEGIYLAAFGSVRVIGGSLLKRYEGRPRARSVRATHWRSLLPAAALAVILPAAHVRSLPPSQRRRFRVHRGDAGSFRHRQAPDRVAVIPIGRRAWRAVRVEEDILPPVGIAQAEDRRRNGPRDRSVDAEAHATHPRGMRPQGALQSADDAVDVGRDLRQESLDELHLRVRGDVPALVRQDVQALVTAGHGKFPIESKETEFFAGSDEEIPEVVFVIADLPLQEDVGPRDAGLPQRIEDQLATGARGFRSFPSTVGQGHDQPSPARPEPRTAGLPIARRDKDRRSIPHEGRIRGAARRFVPIHPDDQVVAGDGSPEPDEGAHSAILTPSARGRTPASER